jgi:F-type H+-transporting ATPase subunit b
MFLSLDGTFWFQLVNFVIFFAILNVVFLRPVGEAIAKRRAYIESVHGDYERFEGERKTLRSEADQKRGVARREADETIAKARQEAEAEATRIVADRTLNAQAIADLARATVATEAAVASGREDELSLQLGKALLERAVAASS